MERKRERTERHRIIRHTEKQTFNRYNLVFDHILITLSSFFLHIRVRHTRVTLLSPNWQIPLPRCRTTYLYGPHHSSTKPYLPPHPTHAPSPPRPPPLLALYCLSLPKRHPPSGPPHHPSPDPPLLPPPSPRAIPDGPTHAMTISRGRP